MPTPPTSAEPSAARSAQTGSTRQARLHVRGCPGRRERSRADAADIEGSRRRAGQPPSGVPPPSRTRRRSTRPRQSHVVRRRCRGRVLRSPRAPRQHLQPRTPPLRSRQGAPAPQQRRSKRVADTCGVPGVQGHRGRRGLGTVVTPTEDRTADHCGSHIRTSNNACQIARVVRPAGGATDVPISSTLARRRRGHPYAAAAHRIFLRERCAAHRWMSTTGWGEGKNHATQVMIVRGEHTDVRARLATSMTSTSPP